MNKLYLLFGDLLLDVITEVAVRNEQDLVRVHSADYLHRRGGCDAHIGQRLERRRGVYVSDYLVVGIHLPELGEHFHIQLLRHGTACLRPGNKHALLRGEYLYGFRHKAHSAHHHRGIRRLCRLLGKPEGIADKISDLKYIVGLVAVR